MIQITIEAIYAILTAAAAGDKRLRLHLENAERQALAEAQAARIEELEAELRERIAADAQAEVVEEPAEEGDK